MRESKELANAVYKDLKQIFEEKHNLNLGESAMALLWISEFCLVRMNLKGEGGVLKHVRHICERAIHEQEKKDGASWKLMT